MASEVTYQYPSVDLVSTQEIALRLNVKSQTVHTWRARGVLPEPDFDLGVGPVWLWETIEEWAEETGRLESVRNGPLCECGHFRYRDHIAAPGHPCRYCIECVAYSEESREVSA